MTQTMGLREDRRTSGREGVSCTVCIAVRSKTGVLYLWKLLQKISIFTGNLDDSIVKGGRIRLGEGGWNGINHQIVDESKYSPAFKIDAEAVCVKEVLSKQWLGHVCQNKLVGEVDPSRHLVDVPYVMIPVPLVPLREYVPS